MGYPYYLDYQEINLNDTNEAEDDNLKITSIQKRLMVSSDVGVFLIRLE